MKVLIADSGFTKTDWRVINEQGEIKQAKTAGINPYYQTKAEILEEMQRLHMQVPGSVDRIYYYGTGCSSGHNRNKISTLLKHYYPQARVEVNHDILAAARALCGNQPGIACILGTGTNSCLYDGKNISDNLPSLGWVMADEGGGTYLGKVLLTDYYRKDMPENLRNTFKDSFRLTKDDFLSKIYQGPAPARFLAGFARFIGEHIKEDYMHSLVKTAFELFISKNVMKYDGYRELPIHFTGSVAYHFSAILREVATEKRLHVKHITQQPIAGLTLFHQ